MSDRTWADRRHDKSGNDRRRHPRGGRRARERRARWRHLTWLFVAYGLYLAVKVPVAISRAWRRRSP